MSIVFTTITSDEEVNQVLDLQQQNLNKNISEDVAKPRFCNCSA
jgi:hypothetical protein